MCVVLVLVVLNVVRGSLLLRVSGCVDGRDCLLFVVCCCCGLFVICCVLRVSFLACRFWLSLFDRCRLLAVVGCFWLLRVVVRCWCRGSSSLSVIVHWCRWLSRVGIIVRGCCLVFVVCVCCGLLLVVC